MQDTKAQLSIDFLIGMVVFAGIFFFVFQFSTAAIAPFLVTSEEIPTKTQRVADNLYFGELSEGEKGELNLTYLEENEDDISDIESDLGIGNTSRLNVTVSQISSDSIDYAADDISPPDGGASVSRTTRFGTVVDDGDIAGISEGDKVIIKVRVW